MPICKETLRKMANSVRDKGWGFDELVSLYGRARNIQAAVSGVRQFIEEEEEAFKERKKELLNQLRRIQGECDHLATTFYPDAAGGSDSSRSCDICGAELTK